MPRKHIEHNKTGHGGKSTMPDVGPANKPLGQTSMSPKQHAITHHAKRHVNKSGTS